MLCRHKVNMFVFLLELIWFHSLILIGLSGQKWAVPFYGTERDYVEDRQKNKTECGNLFIFAEKPGRKCNSEALAFFFVLECKLFRFRPTNNMACQSHCAADWKICYKATTVELVVTFMVSIMLFWHVFPLLNQHVKLCIYCETISDMDSHRIPDNESLWL